MAGGEAVLPAGTIAVRVPESGLRQDARAVKIVWQRELIRFWRDRRRIATAFMQPVLFLFVLGTGLSTIASTGSVNLRTFIFPGALGMAVLFTAVFSAGTIVWDREFGFLREMLVAPVRRWAIVVGKCLGGATVATFQGLVMLALAGVVQVPYAPTMILILIGELLLLSFTLTAFGVLVAARIQQMQTFFSVVQMFLMPLFFLSGSLFPLSHLPGWLGVLNRLDPLTYAIDPMRRAVFDHLKLSAATRQRLIPGVTWWGWRVPTGVELGIVALMGVAMLGVGIWLFSRPE